MNEPNNENYTIVLTTEMLKNMGVKNLKDDVYINIEVKNGIIEIKHVEDKT